AFITLPTIEIVQDNVKYTEVENKDIVINAYVDGNAKEELEIDTYIGSYSEDTPLSTALFYDNEGHALNEFSRTPDISTSWKPIEEIVLGSLFSQYAGRHIKLSGECEIDGRLTKTETHYNEKKFLMIGQTQNLIEDTADSVFVEISSDNYEKN
ncbi:MAG: hypothetical protein HUJ63_10045, partial [Enterococcus sp.]|nr:hypothetical protein [Enterococcus sp.]